MTRPSQVINERRNTYNPGNLLNFPLEDTIHKTVLQFVTFSKDNANSRPYEYTTRQITLPIPENLTEVYGVSYQTTDLGYAEVPVQQGFDIIRQIENGTISNITAEQVTDMLAGGAQWAGSALLMRIVDALDPGIRGSIVRELGYIKNRKTTSIFDGVALRQYTFDWRLSAKSAEESRRIRQIADEVRYRMHPAIINDGANLSFPDEVYIYIFGGGQFDPIYRKAVVTNLSVNNHGAGTPAYFAGTGAPVKVDLSMSFQEVEIMTRNDIGRSATGGTGGVGTSTGSENPDSSGTTDTFNFEGGPTP